MPAGEEPNTEVVPVEGEGMGLLEGLPNPNADGVVLLLLGLPKGEEVGFAVVLLGVPKEGVEVLTLLPLLPKGEEVDTAVALPPPKPKCLVELAPLLPKGDEVGLTPLPLPPKAEEVDMAAALPPPKEREEGLLAPLSLLSNGDDVVLAKPLPKGEDVVLLVPLPLLPNGDDDVLLAKTLPKGEEAGIDVLPPSRERGGVVELVVDPKAVALGCLVSSEGTAEVDVGVDVGNAPKGVSACFFCSTTVVWVAAEDDAPSVLEMASVVDSFDSVGGSD